MAIGSVILVLFAWLYHKVVTQTRYPIPLQNKVDEIFLNLDFTERLVVNPKNLTWQDSPAAGVFRKQFERAHQESGRVTSLVRFDAGAYFESHVHPFGEEILVLEGTFSDENGDYPAGSYLRHPPGTRHAPFSKDGCLIFVKLDHFPEKDNQSVVIRADQRQWLQGIGNLKIVLLHEHMGEHSALVLWPKGEIFQAHTHMGGEEILVIEKNKELLVYDELSLTEIAYCLLYSSVAHLSRQFKKVTGMTPSQFKQLRDNYQSVSHR